MRYSGIGGMSFGAYKSAEEAFDVFRNFLLYKQLEIGQGDFPAFKKGYDSFQAFRVEYQLALRKADAVLKEILAGVDYHAPNYLYANKGEGENDE